jgi:arylsulfatase A-like enzyme
LNKIRLSHSHGSGEAGHAGEGRATSRRAALPMARTAALAGLAWGLAFGLLDALPALLEGDPLENLGRRLLALLFVAVWNAAAFGLVLAVAGLVADAALGLMRRRASGPAAASFAWGLCAALSALGYGLQRYPDGSLLLIAVLALLAGAGVGLLAWRLARQGVASRRTGRWVLIVTGAGLAVLLAVAVLRLTARDWKAFNPRVTGQSATPERPNIVLISIDALRADRLGVYGHQPSPSPRIDELASRGLVFRQAISQGNSTQQAVSSFLTSLYPTELGIEGLGAWVVHPERVTLPEALQAGGYRTQAYVGNGHLVADRGYAQGFDEFIPPEPDRPYDLDRLRDQTVVAGLACLRAPALCPLFERAYGLLFDPPLIMENEGRRINTRALRFLRLHREEQFFLWLHYMEPHAPYDPSRPFGEVPSQDRLRLEETLRAWRPSDRTGPLVLGPAEQKLLWALYDGEVQDADRLVGQVWDQIVAQGLADRTLLVIIADHGDEFADHGDYGHGQSVYQELVHVPLIFVGPQVAQPGRTIDTPVPMLDLLPTLVDVAGAPLPDLVRGQSLLPVLAGGEPPERVFYSQNRANRTLYEQDALYQGRTKLIYAARSDRAELYDLRADPTEQHDLSTADPQRAAALRKELRAWQVAAINTWSTLPTSGLPSEEIDQAIQDALRRIGY